MTGRVIKIFNEKLNFRKKAAPKVKSFENVNYHPKKSQIQIFSSHLSWVPNSQPNLSEKNEAENKDNQDKTGNQFDKNKQKLIPNKGSKISTSNPNNNEYESQDALKQKKDGAVFNGSNNENSNRKNAHNTDNKDSSNADHSNKGRKGSLQLVHGKINVLDENQFNSKNKSKGALRNGNGNNNIQRVSVSTETDDAHKISVEIQTQFDKDYNDRMSNKFKLAMMNSATIPNRNMRSSDELFTSINRGTKYTNYKNNSALNSSLHDDVISNDTIGLVLPSLTPRGDNGYIKQYSTYTFKQPKTYNQYPVITGSYTSSIVHVGLDYLDQYWAAKRKNILNNETTYFDDNIKNYDVKYSNPVKESLRLPNIDPYSESLNSPNLYHANYKQKFPNNSIERIDKITDRDLGRLFD